MSAIRQQVIANAVAAIDAPEKPAGVTVHRTRARPITADLCPAILVYRLAEPTERFDGPHGYVNQHRLLLRFECRVRLVEDGAALDDALDELTGWVVKALMADPSLGGLAEEIQVENTNWAAGELAAIYGAAQLDVAITYFTLANDPDAQ